MKGPPGEISVRIAETVSEALETPAEELPPLSNSIDLDGLDAIVTEDPSDDVSVEFFYAGLRIIVHSSNTVYAYPRHDDDSDPVE